MVECHSEEQSILVNLLVSDPLKPHGQNVAIDMHKIEMGYSAITHGLAKSTSANRSGYLLEFIKHAGSGIRVDGKNPCWLELISTNM